MDELGPGRANLYVDADRDRTIDAHDQVKGDGNTWRLGLDCAVVEGNSLSLHRRTVLLHLGQTGRTIGVATCGYLEGHVALDGAEVRVRRMDGDANGFFADSQDRLWIDVNRDGKWDPLEEQFLYAPVLQLAGNRYATRSDALGQRFALERLEGTGTVRLALRDATLNERVQEMSTTLVGRDGSVVSLKAGRP